MEKGKRKRPGNGEGDGDGDGRRAKSRGDNGEQTVTEEEVEEFFMILRRMHVAVKYLEKDKGGDRKLTENGSNWKPCFEWEDFKEGKGVTVNVNVREKREEGVEDNALLDLNVDPVSEGDTV